MTECRPGCGACCDPVVLPFNRMEAAGMNMTPTALAWVTNDLTPMPMAEARVKAPHLFPEPGGTRIPLDRNGEVRLIPYVFSCRHFDAETRLCGNWPNRPPTCEDFPRYGLPLTHPDAVLPHECEYRADQGLPVIIRPR